MKNLSILWISLIILFSCSTHNRVERNPALFRVQDSCYQALMSFFSKNLEDHYASHFDDFQKLILNSLDDGNNKNRQWKFRAKSRDSIRKKITKIPKTSNVFFNLNRFGNKVGGKIQRVIQRLTSIVVTDGLAGRIVYDVGSKREMDKFTSLLAKAIEDKKIKIVSITNYQSEDGIAYLSPDNIVTLKNAAKYRKYPMTIKKPEKSFINESGYISLHLIVWYPDVGMTEIQVRGRKLDMVSEANHLFYDITQEKPLNNTYKNNPKLVSIYNSFLQLNEEQRVSYMSYTKEYYRFIRGFEMGALRASDEPKLPHDLAMHHELSIQSIWNEIRKYYEDGLFLDESLI